MKNAIELNVESIKLSRPLSLRHYNNNHSSKSGVQSDSFV